VVEFAPFIANLESSGADSSRKTGARNDTPCNFWPFSASLCLRSELWPRTVLPRLRASVVDLLLSYFTTTTFPIIPRSSCKTQMKGKVPVPVKVTRNRVTVMGDCVSPMRSCGEATMNPECTVSVGE
jgi:hypothetical protein